MQIQSNDLVILVMTKFVQVFFSNRILMPSNKQTVKQANSTETTHADDRP